jgi:hypothetical protein
MGESLCDCWKFFLQSQPVPRPDSSGAGSFNNANRPVTVELHLKDPLRRIKRLSGNSAPPSATQISGRLLPAWSRLPGVGSRKGKNRTPSSKFRGASYHRTTECAANGVDRSRQPTRLGQPWDRLARCRRAANCDVRLPLAGSRFRLDY